MMMCHGVCFFGSDLYGTLWTLWTCVTISFTRLGKFLVIISLNQFSIPSSLSSPGIPMMQMLLHFMLSKMFLKLSTFFRILFSFCCSALVFFSTLSFKTLVQSSASCNLLFIPASVLFISDIAFHIFDGPFLWFLCLFSCYWVSLYSLL